MNISNNASKQTFVQALMIKSYRTDGFGIWDTDKIAVASNAEDTEILLMEVRMVCSLNGKDDRY